MDREMLFPASEAEWLEWRKADVTSTEVAALFGFSPYTTEFELYHRKVGNLEDSFTENDRMKWGRRLEAAIAEGIAEDLGLLVEPMKHYGRIADLRMGSSFDYQITGLRPGWEGDDETYRNLFKQHGPGILEVKNVDSLVFKRGWMEGDTVEAPPHIEFQVQHQMEVADLNWCIIAPLVGGNTPRPFWRVRDEAIGKVLVERVKAFWQQVADGVEPEPDYERDAATIGNMFAVSSDKEIDLSDNNRLAELCAAYDAASADEKDAKARKDAAKAEILTIIEDAGKVRAAGYTISAKTTAESKGKLVTPDMVGTYMGARKAYRGVRLNAAH